MKFNKWFELRKGDVNTAHGNPMFDGDNTPNMAIQFQSEIVPRIQEGDEITICYSQSSNKISRVKLIENVTESEKILQNP